MGHSGNAGTGLHSTTDLRQHTLLIREMHQKCESSTAAKALSTRGISIAQRRNGRVDVERSFAICTQIVEKQALAPRALSPTKGVPWIRVKIRTH